MFNINDLHFFVLAVDQGGFAAAGRHLNLPKSTVSKRVAALETALGTQLIHRTSRSFVLTDVGKDVLDHARAAIAEAEAVRTVVHHRLAEPSGLVRLTTSVPNAQYRLAALLPVLARRYPKLRLQLHVSDRFVDLVHDGFDIAVRSHFSPLPDSELRQRRIKDERIILVAAPSYLAERGVPQTPEELRSHDGLMTNPRVKLWRLQATDGTAMEVAPQPRFYSDESVPLLAAAQAGLGVVALPELICAVPLAGGRLRHVLPDWTAGRLMTTILTPPARAQLPSVRVVIDFLVAASNDAAV